MCLRIPIRRSLFHGNLEQLGSNASAGHNVKFSGGTWHQINIRERGPSRGIIQKCEPHEHSPCARRFEEKSHEETSKQESWFRKAAWDLAKNIYKLRNKDEATFYSSCGNSSAGTCFKITRGTCVFLFIRDFICICRVTGI